MPFRLQIRRRQPLTSEDLTGALAAAKIEVEPAQGDGGAWWSRYPLAPEEVNSRIQNQRGQLWFRAAAVAPGALEFSVSHSNAQIERNATDLLRRLPAIAERLGGRVFLDDDAIDAARALAACDDAGPFMAKLREGHRAALAAIDEMPLAAIEVPLGRSELLDEFALFEVIPQSPVTKEMLTQALTDPIFSTSVLDKGDFLVAFECGQATAGARRRDDGRWQIRPLHGRVVWTKGILSALKVMRKVWILGSGEMTWQGEPLGAELYRSIEARTHGSALEFALYARSAKPNQRVVEPGSAS